MLRCTIAAVSLVFLVTPPLAAEDCGWLPTADVGAALPAFAPWSVMVGGTAGSCKFVSRGGPPNIFGANQMVKPRRRAASFVRVCARDGEVLHRGAVKNLGAERSPTGQACGLSDRSITSCPEVRIAVIASRPAVPLTADHVAGRRSGPPRRHR